MTHPLSTPDKAALPSHIGRWRARRLRSARQREVLAVFALVALAGASIWAGNRAALHLSPMAAVGLAKELDELEVPGYLPSVSLVRDDGTPGRLWDLMPSSRSIVAFYAPWCAPCQRELPKLIESTRARGNLVVVVSGDEDRQETRRQLDNIGLRQQRYWIDHTGALVAHARVSSLPTTFLVGRNGRVHERVVGYSELRLTMLIAQAGRDDE